MRKEKEREQSIRMRLSKEKGKGETVEGWQWKQHKFARIWGL